MSFTYNYNYPTPIRFGPGRIAELAEACTELGITRPLLVTDPGLAKLPITAKAVAVCREAGQGITVFSDIKANPVGANVADGAAAYRANGCDGVIAFGGGSGLDVGKAVALMANHDLPLWDFEDAGDNWLRADPAKIAPIVAVPTTAGTGSEVGRCSVIVDEKSARKVVIFHPLLLPGKVIDDPELTVGLPAHITAAVGMDALSHNLEAYCAPGFHPMADGIALEGIRLCLASLEDAVRDGTDIVARSNMMAASTMGATAFQKGLGAMHSLSHPIGAALDAHHGLTNAVVMPYVLLFNRTAIEARIEALARYCGLTGGFGGFVDRILALREMIGIAETTASLGMTEQLCVTLAPKAALDPTAGTNPIPLTPENLEQLYRASLDGVL
jgi:alcohol dehydrogenase class IV